MKLEAALELHAVEDGDCLRWTGPVITKRHPVFSHGGSQHLVRRALYERDHGSIPEGRILRVTCGMPLCVRHFELTTYKAVAVECGRLGLMSGPVRSARIAATKRAGPQAKLTEQQVAEIRASDESIAVLGKRYGISESHASRVRNGQHRREFATPWQALMPRGM